MRIYAFRFSAFFKFICLMLCTAGAAAMAQSIQISPSPIDFGSLAQGTRGNPWSLNVNNTSNASISLGSITLSDASNFSQTNTCGASLSAYSSCTIQVAFTPSATGLLTATLRVPNGDTGSPQGVGLSGTGTAASGTAHPVPVLSPSQVNFGSQSLHTTSNGWTVNLGNQGAGALNISSIAVSDPADFAVTSDCGAQLSAYSSCHLVVTFSPNTVGTVNGTVTVTDDAGTQTLSLTGLGLAPAATVLVAPTSIDFGQQAVGVAANVQTVTVNNTGDVTISLGGFAISPSAGFSYTTTCTGSLSPHSTCLLALTFTPATAGATDATLTFMAASAAQSLPLHGTGVATQATVVFSPSSVDFGAIPANTTSGTWTLSVNNTSAVAAAFSQPLALSGSSAFHMTTSCGNSLAAYSSCAITVSFAPTAAGPYSGLISATVQGTSTPQTITLTGSATANTPVVQFSPSAIDFGAINVGASSNAWTVNVSNPTGATVAFTNPIAVAGSAAFTLSTNCGMSLAPYSSCSVTVSFAPRGLHPTTGQIVGSVAGGDVQTVSLTGTGTGTLPTPSLQVSPLVLDFGTVIFGAPNPTQTVTVTNAGIYDAMFTGALGLTGSSLFHIVTNNCPTTLAGGASCSVGIQYTPNVVGTATGQLVMTAQSLTDPLTVALNATTVNPDLQLSATAIDFGTVNANTDSSTIAVVVSNPGSLTSISLAASTVTGGSNLFNLSSTTCGSTIAAGGSCTIYLVFHPVAAGAATGAFTVTSSNTGHTQTVSLTGMGNNPLPLLVPSVTSMDWGAVQIGTNTTRTISVTNQGASSVRINMNVPHNSGYTLQSTTCSTLAVGDSCSATVNFSPGNVGIIQGVAIFAVNGVSYQVNVPLQAEADALTFPDSASFTNTNVNSTSTATFTINNPTGYTPTWTYGVSGPFAVTGGTCPATGGTFTGRTSCTVIVTFSPTSAGLATGSLTASESGVTHVVALSGTGIGGAVSNGLFSVSANPLDFGTVTFGTPVTRTLTITNVFYRVIQINSPGPANQWAMTAGNCATIPVNGSCTMTLVMTPTATGPASTQFLISAPGHTQYTFMTLTANVVPAPTADYSLAVNPQSLSLASGQTGSAAFTLTPTGGYAGSVALSCDGLPSGATCSFAPSTLTADGTDAVQSSTLTVSTVGINTAMNQGSDRRFELASFGILPAVMLIGLFGFRKRLRLMPLIVLLALGSVLGGTVGCGEGLSSKVTPVGTTQVKVTATALANGKTTGSTHSATFTLNITR